MQTIPSPSVIRKLIPITSHETAVIASWRQTIADILSRRDKRLLVIVGPCAIHRPDSAIEYAEKLSQLSKELSSHFFFIMRAYVEKSRTVSGWKGYLYSHRDGEKKISLTQGIIESRSLFRKFLQLQIPIGMEFLEPIAADYLSDFVSWGSIGAKTVLSPPHRELASRLPLSVGLKNSPDGSIEGAVNGIITARKAHTLFGVSPEGHLCQIHSSGNPYAHLVLRGGLFEPNYSEEHIHHASKLLQNAGALDAILIDCSHGNSQKRFERQPLVFFEVLEGILAQRTPQVRGLMIESFLLGSSQDELLRNALSEEEKEYIFYGASKVDSCLDWKATEKLLREAHARLANNLFVAKI